MHTHITTVLLAGYLAAAFTAPLGAQAAPTNVTAIAGRGTVTVSWTGIRNKEVTYRVLRAPDAKSPGEELTRSLSFAIASFVDAKAVPGTTYLYRVIAVYADGSEGASAVVQYPAPEFRGA